MNDYVAELWAFKSRSSSDYKYCETLVCSTTSVEYAMREFKRLAAEKREEHGFISTDVRNIKKL